MSSYRKCIVLAQRFSCSKKKKGKRKERRKERKKGKQGKQGTGMCLQVRTAEARHENDFIFKTTLHLTKSTYELSRIYDLEK